MRLQFTLGRMVVFDFTMFEIAEPEDKPDVVVVHHYSDDEDDDKPDDIFGSK